MSNRRRTYQVSEPIFDLVLGTYTYPQNVLKVDNEGPQGQQGPQGLRGLQGKVGPTGKNGAITNTINYQKVLKYKNIIGDNLNYSSNVNFKLSVIDKIITLNINQIIFPNTIQQDQKFMIYIDDFVPVQYKPINTTTYICTGYNRNSITGYDNIFIKIENNKIEFFNLSNNDNSFNKDMILHGTTISWII